MRRTLPFRPKALVADIDGTLTDDRGLLSLDAVRAIRELESRGVMVILASGNALPVVRSLSMYLGCSGPVIAEDGGVVAYRDRIVVMGSREEALRALEELKRTFGDAIKEALTNPYRHTDVAIRRTIPVEEVARVISRYPSLKVVDSGFAYHIHSRAIDKGGGLLTACRLAGLRLEEVVAVGDSELDIPMFEVAGFSAATANAPGPVKARADYVASKPYGEGFVEVAEIVLSAL